MQQTLSLCNHTEICLLKFLKVIDSCMQFLW
jgi:hypothetical protein